MRSFKALVVVVLLLGSLAATPEAEGQAYNSSPSDCSVASGAKYSFVYGHQRWWDFQATTYNSYGTVVRDHCRRAGAAPAWTAGFFGTSSHAQKSKTAYFHNGANSATVVNSAICGGSGIQCINFTSWHSEKWGYGTAAPFHYFNY